MNAGIRDIGCVIWDVNNEYSTIMIENSKPSKFTRKLGNRPVAYYYKSNQTASGYVN